MGTIPPVQAAPVVSVHSERRDAGATVQGVWPNSAAGAMTPRERPPVWALTFRVLP